MKHHPSHFMLIDIAGSRSTSEQLEIYEDK